MELIGRNVWKEANLFPFFKVNVSPKCACDDHTIQVIKREVQVLKEGETPGKKRPFRPNQVFNIDLVNDDIIARPGVFCPRQNIFVSELSCPDTV
jgi:hypothetical protein